MKQILLAIPIFGLSTLASAESKPTTKTTLANPAATFCVENDGEYQIRTHSDGSQTGVCILPDGKEVDAWDYIRAHYGD
ncbi:MAG: DUF333 domain-containing protein [Pseudomonadota bacterium]